MNEKIFAIIGKPLSHSLSPIMHSYWYKKYNINANSALGAKEGNEYHFGRFSNFNAWKNRWGWYYEDIVEDFEQVKDNYTGTLIRKFYDHDITTGPLKSINL